MTMMTMMIIYQQMRDFPPSPFGLSSRARELGPSSTVLLQTIADDAAASPSTLDWANT